MDLLTTTTVLEIALTDDVLYMGTVCMDGDVRKMNVKHGSVANMYVW